MIKITTRTISFYQVVRNSQTDVEQFVRIEPVQLLRLISHEIIILQNNEQLVLTSNYDILANSIGDTNVLCLMFSYCKDGEKIAKLYPLPLTNTNFTEGMATDRFTASSPESIKSQLLEDPEICNLIDQYKDLLQQTKAQVEIAKSMATKTTAVIENIAPKSETPKSGKSPYRSPLSDRLPAKRTKADEITILSRSTNVIENKKQPQKMSVINSNSNSNSNSNPKKSKNFNKWMK